MGKQDSGVSLIKQGSSVGKRLSNRTLSNAWNNFFSGSSSSGAECAVVIPIGVDGFLDRCVMGIRFVPVYGLAAGGCRSAFVLSE
jgi:hypothetical protein